MMFLYELLLRHSATRLGKRLLISGTIQVLAIPQSLSQASSFIESLISILQAIVTIPSSHLSFYI